MTESLPDLLHRSPLSHEDLVRLLGLSTPREVALLRARAMEVLEAHLGTRVYYRGIIEFSNVCAATATTAASARATDRSSGSPSPSRRSWTRPSGAPERATAPWCCRPGERRDPAFVDLGGAPGAAHPGRVRRCPDLPQGLGITLSLGEQSPETYRRWREAGAHRYLLRIETTESRTCSPGSIPRPRPWRPAARPSGTWTRPGSRSAPGS